MKHFILALSIGVFFLIQTRIVEAAYVLPYPSYLPGNKLYRVSEFVDSIKKYWYFGTLTQLKYVQEMSDKHLIEAKTLFEYKQYALGVRALEKSNTEASAIPSLLMLLSKEKKSSLEIKTKVNEEMKAHQVVLQRMFSDVPGSIDWVEEKKAPEVIDFSKLFEFSIGLREKVASE
jgi:hypothetical protein